MAVNCGEVAKRERTIPKVVKELTASVDGLSSAWHGLNNRLEPVLTPSAPANKAASEDKRNPSTLLADLIQEQVHRITSITAEVVGADEQLEL